MSAQRAKIHDFLIAATGLGVTVLADEPLARHTTFRIGGPADLYAAVADVDRLAQTAELATNFDIPFIVLGGGSNVLVSDAGVRGLVIANQTRDFGLRIAECGMSVEIPHSEIRTPQLVADSGVPLAGLGRFAVREGWAGLEWAVSIPGTVGGAVIGNAGAHGGCIADCLAWAEVYYPGQERRVLTTAELGYNYRSSILKEQLQKPGFSEKPGFWLTRPIVLRAAFNLARGDVAGLTARADRFLARRRAAQPVEPSAGSVFRNPAGDYAGRLIEAVGLKGYKIGGAQISPRHANFIVNTGAANAADVLGLINLARVRVAGQFGVELTLEIELLGEWERAEVNFAAKT